MEELLKKYKLNKDATKEDVDAMYKSLKAKLSEERFAQGEKGAKAAKKLTQLEEDYREMVEFFNIQEEKKHPKKKVVPSLSKVEKYIEDKDYNAAQDELDKFTEQTAAWHYLQSMVYWRKNWQSESKKELEKAMAMDPSNQKYIEVYNKMIQRMSSTSNNMDEFTRKFEEGMNNPNGQQPQQVTTQQCSCCDLCSMACLLNMCCRGCR